MARLATTAGPSAPAAIGADTSEAALRDCLGAIAHGSESALESFYRHFHRSLHAFADKLVRNPADASELVNETMLEVWRGAGRFRQQSRVRTWLFSIAHHRAIDLLRRRREHQDVDELKEYIEDPLACGVLESAAGAQHSARLRQCLDELPARQRSVLHLAFFEDLSYPEVASALAVPLGTIKTRVLHAKVKLLACLSAAPSTTGART